MESRSSAGSRRGRSRAPRAPDAEASAPARRDDAGRKEEVAAYLKAAIAYVDGMSDFLTVTLHQRGRPALRDTAPHIEYGEDIAEVLDTIQKADAFAASCAAGLSRFIAWTDVTPEIWEACWRGAARGWSSLVRIACLRCAEAMGIALPEVSAGPS